MKKKFGWTGAGLCGLIFASIGAIFLPVGWVVSRIPASQWEGEGGPELFRYVFCGIGALFLVIGLGLVLVDVRRRYLLRRAYNMGNCVEAEILGMETNRHMDVNGRNPSVVECAYTDASGVVHIYRSRYLYMNVRPLLKAKTVPVYIDRDNENIGFVDIDAVLPEIKIHR